MSPISLMLMPATVASLAAFLDNLDQATPRRSLVIRLDWMISLRCS
jgi:hypothetical protein